MFIFISESFANEKQIPNSNKLELDQCYELCELFGFASVSYKVMYIIFITMLLPSCQFELEVHQSLMQKLLLQKKEWLIKMECKTHLFSLVIKIVQF